MKERAENKPLSIRGPNTVRGVLHIQGSKNSMLPILAASLLRPGNITLDEVPQITDKDAVCEILAHLGCEITAEQNRLVLNSENALPLAIPPKLMAKTRGAFIFLGAMLARFHKIVFSMPGGCFLGKRPIDFHLQALTKMGARFIETAPDCISGECDALTGCHIILPFPSVGATENIILAACGADGETILENAACEPEVLDFIAFLRSRGFLAERAGKRRYVISGSPRTCKTSLSSAYKLMPDRIAAATYLCMAAATGGELLIPNITEPLLPYACTLYRRSGCRIAEKDGGLYLCAPKELSGVGRVVTAPYPGFATDMQPLFLAMLCTAASPSSFYESIFENRFSHAAQLIQMGAHITIEGKTAAITEKARLVGRHLLSPDLRGGAALALAAAAAEGKSILHGVSCIRRGYDHFAQNLSALGVDIEPAEDETADLPYMP